MMVDPAPLAKPLSFDIMSTPIGELLLASTDKGLAAIVFAGRDHEAPSDPMKLRHPRSDRALCRLLPNVIGEATLQHDPAPLIPARRWLDRYFTRDPIGVSDLEMPLDMHGTPFMHECWNALARIPYGRTCSYGELAAQLGKPGAARAVGLANNRNPLPIVIPCHRVLGSTGKLVGYGGGLWRKTALLHLERGGELFA